MNSGQVNIAAIACRFSDLIAFTTNPDLAETIFSEAEPFGLRVAVEFGGGGAIALMPLALPVQVDFFAKPYGRGEAIELGTALLKTTARQFLYHPTLEIANGPGGVGLIAEKVYNVSALLRVGTPEGPSFITGFIENLAVQTYNL
jgi:hypothetical protein